MGHSSKSFYGLFYMILAFYCAAFPAVAGETFGAKLRRLAAAAAISNPSKAPPLLPAPAWTANTAYVEGESVQNGANVYICRFHGISAASGGPSTKSYADIVDGTVTWVYGGPAFTGQDVAAPKVGSTANLSALTQAGLTKYYNPLVTPLSFTFDGGAPSRDRHNSTTQVAFPSVHYSSNGLGGNVGLDNGMANNGWSASFVTDAPILAIGASYGGEPPNILVDGRRLFPGGVKGALAAGKQTWYTLDFTDAGGRKARTISFQSYGNIYFAGVRVDGASSVSTASTQDSIRVAFFGSSIEVGGNGFPVLSQPSYPVQVSQNLGWSYPLNAGLGGTGYINDCFGRSYNYQAHLADVTSVSPDIVVVGGPINDGAGWSSSAITSAASNLFLALRSALPNAIIIALGTYPGRSGSLINSELAVSSAVQRLSDPHIYFIPISSGDGHLMTGKGFVTKPDGSGNSDFYISSDHTHQTQIGNNYLAEQIAARIKAIVINTLP